jgi:eukaryotic-like serine/threonine-protein kinase
MARWKVWLKCIGHAVYKNGLRGLAGLMPFGECLYDIVVDAYRDLRQASAEEGELRAGVAELAVAPAAEVRAEAERVAEAVAPEQPADIKLQLISYLTQVPASVRASLRRPADPAGVTVPANLPLRKPDDLLPLLPARPPRFRPGDHPPGVGDWELVELLGVGGFGEVWKAKHVHFDGIPPVALKFCLDPQAQQQIMRHEAAVLNQVMRQGKHPGIVPLLDAHLSAEPPCLKYEYVGGGDLSGLVAGWNAVPPPDRVARAARLVLELAEIIAFAHKLDPPIVHRDLKPANILLQPQADGRAGLRVADFGIGGVAVRQAREQTVKGSSRGEFLATALRGSHTPLYASPQQMRGEHPDPRDDVHALGVIWLQLLTGDLTSGASADWRDEIAERGVPEGHVRLLGSCLASRAERRPADAAILVEELRKVLADGGRPTPVSKPPETHAPPPPEPTVRLEKQLTTRAGLKFVLIPAGTFLMGSPDDEPERYADEGPRHRVTLTRPFYLGVYPVAVGQFRLFVEETGYQTEAERDGTGSLCWDAVRNDWRPDPRCTWRRPGFDQTDQHPVVAVSWHDAVAFTRWLTEREGRAFRLATEAEWEYAARAGTATPFWWGATAASHQANFNGNFPYGGARKGPYLARTSVVDAHRANPWGLYDMLGNVWEWCQDWYGEGWYAVSPEFDPTGPPGGSAKVLRGSSWLNWGKGVCRCAVRGGYAPSSRYNYLGFRVAASA